MGLIKGITVKLYEKQQTGTDGFNRPIYEQTPVEVKNVLVAPASGDDVAAQTRLTGKRETYTLAIPKGDKHAWEDTEVEFFGKRFRTSGPCLEGIESLIPLSWNKKVTVERYEQDQGEAEKRRREGAAEVSGDAGGLSG